MINHNRQTAQFASLADHLCEIERQRTQALVLRDMDLAWALHAADYQLISPGAASFSRERYLGMIAAGTMRYLQWTPGPIAVRCSPQMALLRYRVTLQFDNDDGPGQPFDCWHLDSYELIDSHWQAVWSQATKVPPPSA